VIRTKFAAWLFNGSSVANELTIDTYQGQPPTSFNRLSTFKQLCHIQCDGGSGYELGYQFCGFRDCSWAQGDFYQSTGSPRNSLIISDALFTITLFYFFSFHVLFFIFHDSPLWLLSPRP
jgi:hypothetical protein